MLTYFGKKLRKFRIDQDLTIITLASNLNFSTSFISAIEKGNTSVSSEFLRKFFKYYKINKEEQAEWENLANLSKTTVTFNLKKVSENARILVYEFENRFNKLSDEQIEKILEVLKRNEDQSGV